MFYDERLTILWYCQRLCRMYVPHPGCVCSWVASFWFRYLQVELLEDYYVRRLA